MATQHDAPRGALAPPSAVTTDPRRASGPRRPSWSALIRPTRRWRAGLSIAAAVLVVGLSAAPVFAAPVGQQSRGEALAAEIERIAALVAAAEGDLERATVEAEAAADASRIAQAALADAEVRATAAAAELEASRLAVAAAQEDVAALGREVFMGADPLAEAAALLAAGGPEEVVDRAATLDILGESRTQRLEDFRSIQGRQERADQAARASVAERDVAARAASEAEATAQAQVAASQQAYDAAAAQKAALDQQLRQAEISLLAAQGVADPSAVRDEQQRAELAAARAGSAALVAGRVTSCYGSRSGAMHNGVDIAAPIGTPIYAPAGGVVLDAGPANGFGLAVYIQHPDGTITLYGHINQYFVSAGQQVAAGQLIAEVGNKGQSTGPHLHIETHQGGLYQNRINPAPWLSARGITLGGSCS